MNKKESKVMRSFQIRMITSLAQGKFTAVNLKNDLFVKWLVGYMVDYQIPFRLIPMGGGVTRIVQEGVLCPHCEGRGFFEGEVSARPELLESVEALPKVREGGCGGNCSCSGGCADGGECCQTKKKAA